MIEDSDRDQASETAPTKVVSPGCFPPTAAFPSTPHRSSEPDLASFRQTTVYEAEYEASHPHKQPDEAKRLRRQVQRLKFLLVTSIVVLGGTLSGMLLGLRQEQVALRNAQRTLNAPLETPLEAPVETPVPPVSLPTVSLPGSEQFEPLKEQIRTLTEQTQAVSEQLRETSEQLPEVTASQWSDLKKRLTVLEQAIQDNLSNEALSEQLDQLSERRRQLLDPTIPEASTPEASVNSRPDLP